MMNIVQAINKLREKNEPVPKPMRLPNEEDVKKIENEYNIKFPKDYRKYLLEASDVVLGSLEPATIANSSFHTHISHLFKIAKLYGISNEYIPFCNDNADLFCINKEGNVKFWSHDYKGFTNEEWNSLADWIEKVWIEENS